MMSKMIILTLFILFLASSSHAENERIASAVYAWDHLEVERSETRERRHVFNGTTHAFEYLQVHASTVEPGMAAHTAHTHDDHEELIIIKQGTMALSINGESRTLSPGSVALVLPGDLHGIRNAGNGPATYYVIRWRTKGNKGPTDPTAVSLSVNWDDLDMKQTSKGGRRSIMRVPTSMLWAS